MEIKKSEARDILKDYLPDYLVSQGLRINKGNACPICGSGQRKKNVFHYNRKNNTVTCFGDCGTTGDIFTLVAAEYNLTNFNEILDKTASLLGFTLVDERGAAIKSNANEMKRIRPPKHKVEVIEEAEEVDYLRYISWCAENNDFKYLESRGISREVQKKFLIGLDKTWRNPVTVARWKAEGKNIDRIPISPRCIIPNSRYSYLARDTRKDLTEKQEQYSKQVAGKKRLFNHKALAEPGTFFVVEGEIDALSIIEAGFTGIGLCGASNIHKMAEEMKKDAEGKKVVVLLDPDETGQKKAKLLCEELEKCGIPNINALDFLPLMDGDPNKQLVADRNEFKKTLCYLNFLVARDEPNKLPTYKEMFTFQRTVEEIAALRGGIKISTVESTALELYIKDDIDNIDFLINEKYTKDIIELSRNPRWDKRLTTIKENMPEDCSFTCIHAVLEREKKENAPQQTSLDGKIGKAKEKAIQRGCMRPPVLSR